MTVIGRDWRLSVFLSLIVMGAWPGSVQAEEDLDVTMRMVMDDEDLTNAVVREIELPSLPESEPSADRERPDSPAARREGSGQPERRGKPDIETALDTLERGQEIGEIISERAREARDLMDADRPGRGNFDEVPGKGRPDDLPAADDLRGGAGELRERTKDLPGVGNTNR